MSTKDHIKELQGLVTKTITLFNNKETQKLIDFFDDLHPVELAGILNSVNEEIAPELLKHVTGLDDIANLTTYANDDLRHEIIKLLDDARIAAIIRRQEPDDAANFLSMLRRRHQLAILRRLDNQSVKEITSLLSYDKDTAGRMMTPLFLKVPKHLKTDEAVLKIREDLRSEKIDPDTTISYVYIIDSNEHLIGVMSLRELLASPSNTPLSELMTRTIISVNPEEDQEEVAKLISDYDFTSLPVIDGENGKLLGIITVDDILDVIEEETTEDMLKLAGTEDTDTIGATVYTAFKSRLPWLFASWIGGIGAVLLLNVYETTLEKLVALAFFMPVVFGMGGNIGSQSSTITVRGIATGDLSKYKVSQRFSKEMSVGALLGFTFGSLLGLASFILYKNIDLSLVVATSILLTMTLAATIGSMLPVLFNRLGFDPAISSGPFVTTTTDVLATLIYFSVASLLIS